MARCRSRPVAPVPAEGGGDDARARRPGSSARAPAPTQRCCGSFFTTGSRTTGDELAVTPHRFREQMELPRLGRVPGRRHRRDRRPPRRGRAPGADRRPELRRRLPRRRRARPARARGARLPGDSVRRHGRHRRAASFAWYERQPPLLGWDEIAELDRGGTLRFEAHTVTHPNLLAVDDDDVPQPRSATRSGSSKRGSAAR